MIPSSSRSPLVRARRTARSMIALTVAAGSLAASPDRALAQVGDTASARAEALFAAKDYVGAASAFQALTRTHPQQRAVPSARRAQVRSPAATSCVARITPATGTGVA